MKYLIFLIIIFPVSLFSQLFNYDDLNRLTETDYGNGTKITYTYDKLGNRTSSVQIAPVIPCPTPTNLSASNITETTVTLQWTGVSGATSYTIQYCENGTSSCNTVVLSNTIYNLNGLIDGTTYDWRVKAMGCDADSPWTSYSSFTTIETGPNCPTDLVITLADAPYDSEYQTSNTISTSGDVTIAINQDVTFQANQVDLLQGFDAVSGSFFLAEIAACMAAALREEEEKLAIARNRIDPAKEKVKNTCGHQLQIFPNPIGQNATIEYNLHDDTELQIAIYAMDGRLVGKPILNITKQLQGIHTLNLNAEQYRKGQYICRMVTSDNCVVIQKITVQ